MKINIVFEGSGIKGIAYIGVLKFLEERAFWYIRSAARASVRLSRRSSPSDTIPPS